MNKVQIYAVNDKSYVNVTQQNGAVHEYGIEEPIKDDFICWCINQRVLVSLHKIDRWSIEISLLENMEWPCNWICRMIRKEKVGIQVEFIIPSLPNVSVYQPVMRTHDA